VTYNFSLVFSSGSDPIFRPAGRTHPPPQADREPTTGPRRTSALTPTSFTSDANRLTKATRQYDGWGNLTSERQEQWAGQNHYDQTVAYSFSYSSGSNYLRPASVVYPTGSRTLTYGYGDSSAGTYTSAKVSDQVNRMDRLTWDGTLVNVFAFTGADRTDSRTYRKGTGQNDLVAQTNYKFDAFGRMSEIDATDTAGAHVVDFRGAYDYNGNPLCTEYAHKTTRSEIYGTQTGGSPRMRRTHREPERHRSPTRPWLAPPRNESPGCCGGNPRTGAPRNNDWWRRSGSDARRSNG
jgi:hypothetical protein